MKHILLFMVLVTAAAGLQSCEKKKCYKCTSVYSVTGQASTITYAEYCNKKRKQIKEIEEAGTSRSQSGAITVSRATSCVQQ